MQDDIQTNILFGKSKWIWCGDGLKKNSNVIFRRTFGFGTEKPPARAIVRAACDTHYYLFVNGNAVVWEGGFNRGGNSAAYYDEFDIGKYLVKGDNVIVCYCTYFGNDGRDMVCGSRAGFIFECNELKIYSDESFTAYENAAYKPPQNGNCLYAGRSIVYDASLEGQIQGVLEPSFNSSLFKAATVLDDYPDSVNGVLLPRPLPLNKFSANPVICKFKKSTDQFDGDTYTISLPYTMRLTPYMEVTGGGQEKIRITTDRTDCQGSFGDEDAVYRAHKIEYYTKSTINIFEGLLPMTGQKLIFTMPRSVKVLKLGYREMGYDTQCTVEFSTGDERTDTLFEKALRTLYCCLGSTLMDTPERERTLWLGDSSIESRALYLAYADAAPLVSKVLEDIFVGADGDILNSGVPGSVTVDIPAHGLLALSEFGIFAQYLRYCGKDVLEQNYTRLCDYLMLWEMTENGVVPREGDRSWYDNLYNADAALIENALYYSALSFMRRVGEVVGDHDYDEEFGDRMENIADYIESCWDGMGYTTSQYYDDRANALITLCGLVTEERKNAISRILCSVFGASPYLEWAVIEALCKLNRRDLAFGRFKQRYLLLSEDENTTLGEDFSGYGTKCQGWHSAVIFELIELFGGIAVKNGATVVDITPDFTALKDFRASISLASGELEVRYKYQPTRIDISIDNRTTAAVTLIIEPELIGKSGTERRTITVSKGKNKFVI